MSRKPASVKSPLHAGSERDDLEGFWGRLVRIQSAVAPNLPDTSPSRANTVDDSDIAVVDEHGDFGAASSRAEAYVV